MRHMNQYPSLITYLLIATEQLVDARLDRVFVHRAALVCLVEIAEQAVRFEEHLRRFNG